MSNPVTPEDLVNAMGPIGGALHLMGRCEQEYLALSQQLNAANKRIAQLEAQLAATSENGDTEHAMAGNGDRLAT